MTKVLIKVPRSGLKNFAIVHCKTNQEGNCAVCGKFIDFTKAGRESDYAVDHNHDTGEIRGVLHRSCNASEGKVRNAAARWGAKCSVDNDEEIIKYLDNLVIYLKRTQYHGTGRLYPEHKTKEQKQDITRLRRNKAATQRRAAIKQARENAKDEL